MAVTNTLAYYNMAAKVLYYRPDRIRIIATESPGSQNLLQVATII
jgi:hypothetical protein